MSAILAAAGAAQAPAVAAARAQLSSARAMAQDDVETGVEIVLPFNPFGQPVSLDPHRAVNWGPFWTLLPHVWAGLLAFDENGAVVLYLAESVEPNETADVWTARIRPDLLFASGNPITAESFVQSWLRALDPVRPAPMATFMQRVQGYADYLAGASREIGFTVADELTIEITLDGPYASFPSELATFGWAVVDLDTYDAAGDPDGAALSDAGAGLWRFTEVGDDRFVMEPNPNSYLPVSPSISRIVWQVMDGPGTEAAALDLYRDDEVVSADIPIGLLGEVSGDEGLASDLVEIASQASTMAIGFDFNQAPFNDLRFRQAVAAAVDRDAWANEIMAGEFVPATGLLPPVIELTAGYERVAPLPFDPDRARELLDEAGFDPESAATDIVYYQDATGSESELEQGAALLTMIEDNSGLQIRHDTSLTARQISALQGDNRGRQFDLIWWWTVTDTPDLLRTIGHSTSPFMAGWFNFSADVEAVEGQDIAAASEEFDELMETASATLDAAERNDAYRRAEEILIENAVYVPLGHWVQRFVQKPWLQGTRQGAWSGRIPVRFDEQVVVRNRTTA